MPRKGCISGCFCKNPNDGERGKQRYFVTTAARDEAKSGKKTPASAYEMMMHKKSADFYEKY